ncbi:MAG: TolC family protein [Cyclobacteriaceae bacterium]
MRSSILLMGLIAWSCAPKLTVREASKALPAQYAASADTVNSASMDWKTYFQDEHLIALIDTALFRNQELNIFMQEMEILRNEVQARKGEYLPSVGYGAGMGLDKVGRYTRLGALEEGLDIKPEKEFPEPLSDFTVGAFATWEVDIWRKLRNAKKSAFTRYLASVDGRNFMVTNLVAEIANSYYELLALDNELELVRQNIQIQSDALELVKLQKQSARVTELAVKRFEAQLLDTRSIEYLIRQDIVETENRINFLLGRFPQPIQRSSTTFSTFVPGVVNAGIPVQLLENRPDIRQAELELAAAKLDVDVARANFYPVFGISAGLGLQSFNPGDLVKTPESMLYYLAGDLFGPLVNRKAIKAFYANANLQQQQAVITYEQVVLNAYIEVANQLANINNLQNSYQLKSDQVDALIASVDISSSLFRSARADYIEVLLTQEEALESRFELIETKMLQIHAWVNVYKALGGGWK